MEPTRRALRDEYANLHRDLLRVVRADANCRRLMSVPGVGAIVAITFTSAIDDPSPSASGKLAHS
jgi:transposase